MIEGPTAAARRERAAARTAPSLPVPAGEAAAIAAELIAAVVYDDERNAFQSAVDVVGPSDDDWSPLPGEAPPGPLPVERVLADAVATGAAARQIAGWAQAHHAAAVVTLLDVGFDPVHAEATVYAAATFVGVTENAWPRPVDAKAVTHLLGRVIDHGPLIRRS